MAIKANKNYKVYVTYYTDGYYYIGFTQKEGAALASYFGSNTIKDKLVDHKKIIFESKSKTTAKLFELLMQLSKIDDPKCVNDMLNIRLRRSYLKDLPKFMINFEQQQFHLGDKNSGNNQKEIQTLFK